MIFVTLGSQKFQFNRLLQMIDRLLDEGKIKETVFAQIGNSDYEPKNYKYASFLDKNEFEEQIRNCDVLITHSGVATIIAGLKNDKKVIVVPRLSKYGEHVDDHQVQIAQSFSEQNYVMMYEENDELDLLIRKVKTHEFAKYTSQRQKMVKTIRDYLDNI